MHEKPPMMPSAPENNPEENMTLEQLDQKIKELSREIDDLMRRDSAADNDERRLSRGDELPDRETAVTGEKRKSPGRRKLDPQISQKINERARYISQRQKLLQKGSGQA